MTVEEWYLYYEAALAKLKTIDLSRLSVKTRFAVERQIALRARQLQRAYDALFTSAEGQVVWHG